MATNNRTTKAMATNNLTTNSSRPRICPTQTMSVAAPNQLNHQINSKPSPMTDSTWTSFTAKRKPNQLSKSRKLSLTMALTWISTTAKLKLSSLRPSAPPRPSLTTGSTWMNSTERLRKLNLKLSNPSTRTKA